MVLSPDPESGGYTASCPAAPGTMSQGETRDEALANISEALEAWLQSELDRGRDALPETRMLVADEIARILGFREEFGWDRRIETATVNADIPVPA